jgi:hypothetical protein
MKIFFFLLLCSTSMFSQIRGLVTDSGNLTLPSVTVLVENTYTNTSTNDKGFYELNVSKPGKYPLIFRYLGFKTQKINVDIQKFPFELNVKLTDDNLVLAEVAVGNKENPANAIIKNAIASRKQNSEKTAHFKADFYSRGIFKIKNAPKKFLGQEIGDFDGSLDSTGTGIIYLSETVSKITFQKPDKLKERIVASKVSGRDNGFSYNTARSTAFDFYENTLDFDPKIISPIASNAMNYYKYKLMGSFLDESNHMINKIKVIPRRDTEPVFEGYIYIVENLWAIYAVDLDLKGYRMHNEFMDVMNLKQNFSFNKTNALWAKTTQSLDFGAGAFGVKFNGKFNHVYSNYEFSDQFEKKTFSNEIVSFENNSNKKDSVFWNKNRPIPLTEEESGDYIKKDSIFKTRNSKQYLDSIDAKGNKFNVLKLITGYTLKSSFKKQVFNYEGLLGLSSLGFNTVQGWNLDSGFSYTNYKEEEEKGKYSTYRTKFNYGFSDNRLRISGEYKHRFNSQDYATLSLSGGTKVAQYNYDEPISNIVNSISTLFFKDNYMKLYNKEFASIYYGKDIANGVYASANLEYEQRKPLVNTTDYVAIQYDKIYTSNNPLLPNDDTPEFDPHHLVKLKLSTRINFGNKYITRPDGKINLRNEKYPTLTLGLENAFAGSETRYNYQLLTTRIQYELPLSNKGNLNFNLKAGQFFNAKNTAFIDYKHFSGNQTHVGADYLNSFSLLPYYSNSTNDSFLENHVEYADKGYFMNKLPLLNKLKTNLVVGLHNIVVPNRAPYSEISIGLDNLGFGKFKLFRINYIRSYQAANQTDGFTFGLRF